MSIKMLINAHRTGQLRIAIIEENNLSAYQVDIDDAGLTRGNIYRGVVANIQPSLNAAFVDIGEERHGFLPIGDLLSSSWHRQPPKDERRPRIDQVLERGRSILVQVTKDGIGQKGPALTTNIALAGRYLVLMPFDEVRGISRKANDDDARKKVRERLADLSVPEGQGIIVRTNGIDQNKTTLGRDLNALQRLWRRIRGESSRGRGARLIYSDQDLIQQALRDYLDSTVEQVIVDADSAYEQVETYMKTFMPRSKVELVRYRDRVPLFTRFQLEPQIERIYERTVPLPNGGSIVIDNTEALTAVDVNSGRATMYGDHEETVLNVNVEAAREVARQLRLRDIGGLVVIDFIDMRLRKSQRKLEKEMRDAMKGDKARYGVSRISANGLVEINRQRIKQALRLRTHRSCPNCNGIGSIANPDFAAIRMLRHIEARAANGLLKSVLIALHPEVADALQNHHRQELAELEREFDIEIEIVTANNLSRNEERVEWTQRSKTNGRGPAVKTAALSSLDLAPDERPKKRGEAEENENGSSTGRRRRRRGGRRRRRTRGDQAPEEHQQQATQAQATEAPTADEEASEPKTVEESNSNTRRSRSRRRRRRPSKEEYERERSERQEKGAAEVEASPVEEMVEPTESTEPTEETSRRRRRGSRGGRGRRAASRAADVPENEEVVVQEAAQSETENAENRQPRRRRYGSTSRAAAKKAEQEETQTIGTSEAEQEEAAPKARRSRRSRKTDRSEDSNVEPTSLEAAREEAPPQKKPTRRRRSRASEETETATVTAEELTPSGDEKKAKPRVAAQEVAMEASETVEAPEKKKSTRGRRKTATEEPVQTAGTEEEAKPKATRRRRKTASTEETTDGAPEAKVDGAPEEKPKPTRRRRKAAPAASAEGASGEEAEKPKTTRRRRTTTAQTEETAPKSEAEAGGEESKKKPTRRRTTRRKTAAKKDAAPETAQAEAGDGGEEPKPRRTRKKTTEPKAAVSPSATEEPPQWSWLGGAQQDDGQD